MEHIRSCLILKSYKIYAQIQGVYERLSLNQFNACILRGYLNRSSEYIIYIHIVTQARTAEDTDMYVTQTRRAFTHTYMCIMHAFYRDLLNHHCVYMHTYIHTYIRTYVQLTTLVNSIWFNIKIVNKYHYDFLMSFPCSNVYWL